MDATANPFGLFGQLDAWQSMLDRHAELFSEMVPGSSVGFVARSGSGIMPGKHAAGLKSAQGVGQMLSWEITPDNSGMRAGFRGYSGFEDTQVDLLFVAEDEALQAMRDALAGDALSIIKRQIRKGSIMFYVMKTKYQLQDAGYEEFLDTLGLAFLGACR
ncbi:MAG: hypothetical protein NT159_01805 [Proteobacteria bacterium]|nr:hypothetical protein [Pseudomonadota bacterium]